MNNSLRIHNNDFFRQLLFILLLLAVGGLIFFKLNFLIPSFLGALTLYFILRNPVLYLTEKRRWNRSLTALLFTAVTVILILAFALGVFEMIVTRIPSINRPQLMNEIGNIVDNVNRFLGISLISKDLLLKSSGAVANLLSGVINSTYTVALNTFMTVFILYFMLANMREFEGRILSYIPLKGRSLELIQGEVTRMIYSNVIGIPVIMLSQILVSALGYWIVGIEQILFFAFLTALFGLIPIIGTAAVWLPLSIYLFAIGQIWQPIVLIVYSLAILTNTDNVCRMILMKTLSDIHPLIVIFGVMIGIPLFGFWGIIFGPLLISSFLLLLRIYVMEYYHQDPNA